jgi:NSS family neurotransmitter:Na+ symporter
MKERDSFGNHFGVLVALAGSAVGLGNLWRFPYLVGTNGGASFIIIYLFFVFVICLPLMFTEFVIGRRSQNNVFGAFRTLTQGKKPFWGKIGAISVLCAFVILSFYCVVGGWTINYLVKSVLMQFTEGVNFQQMFEHSSTSTTVPLIYTLIYVFLTALIVIMGVKNGIEKYSKIMMPLLFLMVIAIAVHSLTLPGASEGVKFLFYPDFSKVTGDTVLAAMGQAFFSLSIGCGTIITYASYVKKDENIISSSAATAIMDLIFAMLAGVAIMPAVFAFGLSPSEGPGLLFVIIPQIFSQIPFGSVLAILFFIVLFFAALTSSISLLEVVVAFLSEEFKMKRSWATFTASLSVTIVAVLCSLSLGLLNDWTICKLPLFDFLDKLSADFLLPIGGLLFVIFAGWKMSDEEYFDELSNGNTLKQKRWLLYAIRFIVKYIAPIVILIILISGLLK